VHGGGDNFNFNFDNDAISLFTEDENRARLGVTTDDDDKGARIQSIIEKTAAEKAGLKKGDVLTKIGDKKIEEAEDVTKAIRSHKPGDKVAITFLREGKEQKVTAELGKWEGIKFNTTTMPRIQGHLDAPGVYGQWDVDSPREPFRAFTSGHGRPKLGLSIQDAEDGKGVKVLDVEDGSNAAKAGIKEDDVITEVDGKEVKGTDDVTRAVRTSSAEKTSWNFKVERAGKAQTIEVKIPRKLKTADL
jgi:serine protease Do